MTPTTLRAIRTTLGLTQAEAALLVGVQTRSWRHWEGGSRQIPEPVARLVGLLASMPDVRCALAQSSPCDPATPQ
jgi:DNA-binding transcriptional regulator YiaG